MTTAGPVRFAGFGLWKQARPGVLDLYLIRGVARPFLGLLIVTCAVMLLERALRLIAEIGASGVDISYFLPLLAQLVPYYLNLALPAAFMVALAILAARLDDMLELDAIMAGGASLFRIAIPLASVGVAAAALSLAAGGWLEPYGRHGFRTLSAEAANAARIGALQPNALYYPAEGVMITFDIRGADGTLGGVFVSRRIDGEEQVFTGPSGRIGITPGGRNIQIEIDDGRYVAFEQDGGSPMPVAEFRRTVVEQSLSGEASSWRRGRDQKELTVSELIAAAGERPSRIPAEALNAELYSRLARSLTIPLLPFLILPLAIAPKRGRRGPGLLLAGAIVAGFHHALNFMKNLGVAGTLDSRLSIPLAVLLFAALIAVIFHRHAQSLRRSGSGRWRLSAPAGAPSRADARRGGPIIGGHILSSYVSRRIGAWILVSAAAIVILLQMTDIFERGDEFIRRGVGTGGVLYYALLRLPAILQQALPVAALAGALVVFADLARREEISAMRAAGASHSRILLAALPAGVAIALTCLLLAETVTPSSQVRLATWWSQTEPDARTPADTQRWFRVSGDIVRAGGASRDGAALYDIEIFRRDTSGRLTERVTAASAGAGDQRWLLSEPETIRFGAGLPSTERAAELIWPTPLRREDLRSFFAAAPQLSTATAQRALERNAPADRGDAMFATRILRTIAEPLAPLIMLLLALPVAFVRPRGGAMWIAILCAAAFCMLYLVTDGVLTVTAQLGYLPAVITLATPAVFAMLAIGALRCFDR